ncbi:MAG: tetratricopeptide repeat protein, partial [Pirellula sp.]
LTTARGFYQQLDQQPLRNHALQLKLAEAYKNLGYISQELGDLPEAKRNYDQMRAAYESLYHESPQSLEYLSSIATSLQLRASIHSKLSDSVSAESDLRDAIARFKIITSQSHAMSHKVMLALTTLDLAALYSNQNRAAEGQAAYADAHQIAIGLQDESVELNDEKMARNVVQVYNNLSADFERQGKLNEAAIWLVKAITISQRMLTGSAGAPDIRYDLASSTGKLALVYQKLDRNDEARTRFDQAKEILVPLTQEHPLVLRYLEALASHWVNFGALEYGRQAWVDAEHADREAFRLFKELAERQPEAVQHWLDVALVGCNSGDSLYRRGKFEDAKVVLKQALEALEVSKTLEPAHINVLFYSAAAQNNLANVFNGEKKYAEAAEAYKFSVEAMKQLTANNPSVVDFPKKTASGLHNLSTALRRSGNAIEAEAAELEGRQILEQLLESKPDSVEYRNLLVTSLNGLGDIYYDLNRLDDAQQSYDRARTVLFQLVETAGEPARFQTMLGYIYFNLGRIARNRGLHQDAIDWNSQAITAQNIELSLRAGNEESDTKRVRGALNSAYRERARGLFRLGQLDNARADCVQGM